MGWEDGEFDDKGGKYDDVQFGAAVVDNMPMDKFDESLEMGPPKGVHTFIIKGIKINEKDGVAAEKGYDWYVKDKDGDFNNKHFFTAYPMEVELALKEDTSKTIRDFFVLPPGMGSDPSRADDLEVYMKGTTKDAKPTKNNVGFHWRKLKSFLGHVGLKVNNDGSIPPFSGKELRFWPDGVPREVVCTILAPKPDPDDPSVKRYKQIDMFSYKDSEFTLLRKMNVNAPAPSSNGSAKAKEVSNMVDEIDADL